MELGAAAELSVLLNGGSPGWRERAGTAGFGTAQVVDRDRTMGDYVMLTGHGTSGGAIALLTGGGRIALVAYAAGWHGDEAMSTLRSRAMARAAEAFGDGTAASQIPDATPPRYLEAEAAALRQALDLTWSSEATPAHDAQVVPGV